MSDPPEPPEAAVEVLSTAPAPRDWGQWVNLGFLISAASGMAFIFKWGDDKFPDDHWLGSLLWDGISIGTIGASGVVIVYFWLGHIFWKRGIIHLQRLADTLYYLGFILTLAALLSAFVTVNLPIWEEWKPSTEKESGSENSDISGKSPAATKEIGEKIKDEKSKGDKVRKDSNADTGKKRNEKDDLIAKMGQYTREVAKEIEKMIRYSGAALSTTILGLLGRVYLLGFVGDQGNPNGGGGGGSRGPGAQPSGQGRAGQRNAHDASPSPGMVSGTINFNNYVNQSPRAASLGESGTAPEDDDIVDVEAELRVKVNQASNMMKELNSRLSRMQSGPMVRITKGLDGLSKAIDKIMKKLNGFPLIDDLDSKEGGDPDDVPEPDAESDAKPKA